MIRAEKLGKVYGKHGKRGICKALGGVSFTLPDKGLVFILGRSGSGKSTLLNLIGGLDAPTSGELYFEGRALSEYSEKELSDYRNKKVGFIFQDFCLIDRFSVYDNVNTACDLRGSGGRADVMRALEEVGIAELANRKPSQLSAGQKQRAAIARALVKSPEIILADEPTGNIDSETTKVVLDILKRLSRERLVVVISHNADDAYRYGDRIIEIADGKIKSDVSRRADRSNGFAICGDRIYLPHDKSLSEDETRRVNAHIANRRGAVRIVQRGSGFSPTVQPKIECVKRTASVRGKRSIREALAMFRLFFKKRWAGLAFTAAAMTLVMTVLVLSQLLAGFDGGAQMRAAVGGDGINLVKHPLMRDTLSPALDADKFTGMAEDDIRALEQAAGNRAYIMYPVMLPFARKGNSVEDGAVYSKSVWTKEGFVKETAGTLQCDIELLKRRFGVNGELRVLAGEIKDDSAGLIVTDYIADSMLADNAFNLKSYDDIVSGAWIDTRGWVDAIIYTGYKQTLLPRIAAVAGGDRAAMSKEIVEISDHISSRLAVCYSVNPNFREDYVNMFVNEGPDVYAYYEDAYFSVPGNDIELRRRHYIYMKDYVGENEVIMNMDMYNELYGTSWQKDELEDLKELYPEEFEGKKLDVLIKGYDGSVIVDGTFDIVGLYYYGSIVVNLDKYGMKSKMASIVPMQIYFEDVKDYGALLDEAKSRDIYPVGAVETSVTRVSGIVAAFSDIFRYAAVALMALAVLLMCVNGAVSVKRNTYDIGVLRALGARAGTLSAVFAAQIVAASVIVCALTAIGVYAGAAFMNGSLGDGLARAFNDPGIAEVEFVAYDHGMLGADAVLLVLLAALSAMVPALMISRLQPIKIIRSRD